MNPSKDLSLNPNEIKPPESTVNTSLPPFQSEPLKTPGFSPDASKGALNPPLSPTSNEKLNEPSLGSTYANMADSSKKPLSLNQPEQPLRVPVRAVYNPLEPDPNIPPNIEMIRQVSDGVNRCDTISGVPLEILREYDFAYQSQRLFMAFVYFPPQMLNVVEHLKHYNSATLFSSYFPYQCSEIRLGGIGSISPTQLSEESILTLLPKFNHVTEISTQMPSYYYKDNEPSHLIYFMQMWLGLLGWNGSLYNYNGYLSMLYNTGVFDHNITSSLYKGNILICSFVPNTNDIKQINSENTRTIGEKDVYKKAREYTIDSEDVNENLLTRAAKYEYDHTEPIESPWTFAYVPYKLEEAYLCLGVYPKSVSSIGDFSRNDSGIRQLDITWNVELIMSNEEILKNAQNVIDDYLKSFYNVKKFNEYAELHKDGNVSKVTPQAKPRNTQEILLGTTYTTDKSGNLVEKGSFARSYSIADVEAKNKASAAKNAVASK